MDTQAALKAVVKIGMKIFVPGLDGVLEAMLEEGTSLSIDTLSARRAKDIHGRILKTVESSFAQFARSEGLDEGESLILLDSAREIIQSSGVRSGEWAATRFDAEAAAALALNRSNGLVGALETGFRSRIESFLRAYYRAVLADSESLVQLEAEFRSSVLNSLERLSAQIEGVSKLTTANAELASQALVSMPLRPWHLGLSPPGALLRADIDGGVPFHGRESELDDIARWRETMNAIGIWLYIGAGGQGKTRLAIEACRQAQIAGWRAGFLSKRSAVVPKAVWNSLVSTHSKNFFAIDYGETRVHEIRELSQAAAAHAARVRTRIILIARHAGDWWQDLKSSPGIVADLIYGGTTGEPIRLRPLAHTPEERVHSYALALTTFAHRLNVATAPLPEDLSAPYFDRALLLHMQALANVEGVAVKGDRGLLDYILARERRFWNGLAQQLGIPRYLEPAIAQAMAIVTVGGGVRSQPAALELLKKLPVLKGQPEAILECFATVLHQIYPGERWIEPVQPDLLGEHLVQAELDEALIRVVLDD